jgi:transposase-like protein
MTAMSSSGKNLLTGEVEVDETVVGGQETGAKGRQNIKKKLVVVALERRKDGVARAYAQTIDNAGSKQLKPFFKSRIDTEAEIKTDKWRGYGPLKTEFTKLEQTETGKKGKNFPVMHRWIMGLKGWLRGTHHQARDLQAYLDEYCYRYNRNRMKEGIFNNLMQRMMTWPPKTYAQIVA